MDIFFDPVEIVHFERIQTYPTMTMPASEYNLDLMNNLHFQGSKNTVNICNNCTMCMIDTILRDERSVK